MRIAFIHSDKPRERLLASAFCDGVRAHGDEAFMVPRTYEPKVVEGAEVVCLVGVKSRELIRAHWAADIHTVYFDKGYCRGKGKVAAVGWDYWRVAVDAHHPTRYLMRAKRSSARWDALGIEVKPWRRRGEHLLLAGSSQKYHDFYGLQPPTEYYTKLAKQLNKICGRKMVYRPKPSYQEAESIPGTVFSQAPRTIIDELENCHALVTHGSNAAFEAMIHGVPAVILGDAVSKPISSTDINDVKEPRVASEEERMQLLANLAWCQWTLAEIASGAMWANTRPLIYQG